MGWHSSLLIIIMAFGVLFSVIYISTLTVKPMRSLMEPIHPNITQIQALDIVFEDARRTHPEVKDLRVYFSQYNFSYADYEQHPENYRGYQYSLIDNVRNHPELLDLHLAYLHPNGTKYIVDPISGRLENNDTSWFLPGYCLVGNTCDRVIYNAFSGRLVYLVDAAPTPDDFSSIVGAWVDADNGQVVWGNEHYQQSIKAMPPRVQIYDNYTVGRTIKQLLNPPQTTDVEIAHSTRSSKNEFLPDSVRAIFELNNKVVWKNNDSTPHTVTSDYGYFEKISGKFDSGIIEGGKSYQYTFMSEGSYLYHCQIHPFMKGEVSIVPNFS